MLTTLSIAAAVTFRQSLGFSTDLNYILELAASADVTYEFGVPLTAAEATEVRRRNELLEAAAPLVVAVEANPGEFGGIWLDHGAGGIVVVAVVSEKVVRETESLVPEGLTVRFHMVDQNYAQLAAQADRLAEVLDQLSEGGVDVQGWYVDEVANRLHVDVSETTSEAESAIEALLGSDVSVGNRVFESASCTYVSSCTPWRGGIKVDRPGVQTCTSGFNARPTTSSSTRYLLTAGHCGSGTWKHAGSTIGTTSRNSLSLSSPISDSQRVPMSASGSGTPYNVIYVTTSDTARTITSQVGQDGHTLGTTVCSSGYGSGYRCGVIVARLYYHNVGGKTIRSMMADFGSVGGDSGGPVFYSHAAYGTVSQSTGVVGDTLFSPIDFVMTDMLTRLCLNTSCS